MLMAGVLGQPIRVGPFPPRALLLRLLLLLLLMLASATPAVTAPTTALTGTRSSSSACAAPAAVCGDLVDVDLRDGCCCDGMHL